MQLETDSTHKLGTFIIKKKKTINIDPDDMSSKRKLCESPRL